MFSKLDKKETGSLLHRLFARGHKVKFSILHSHDFQKIIEDCRFLEFQYVFTTWYQNWGIFTDKVHKIGLIFSNIQKTRWRIYY